MYKKMWWLAFAQLTIKPASQISRRRQSLERDGAAYRTIPVRTLRPESEPLVLVRRDLITLLAVGS